VTSVQKTTTQKSATYVARLSTDETTARRIADALSESLDPADTACAAFEQADGRWQVDVHFRAKPKPAALRAIRRSRRATGSGRA
jgi:ribosomal protein L11 methyltransferase